MSMVTILIGVLLFLYHPAAAAPSIEATVNPATVTVGQPLEYRVRISGGRPGSITVNPPAKREVFPDDKETKGAGRTEAKKEKKDEEKKAGDFVPLYSIDSLKKDDVSTKNGIEMAVIVKIIFYRTGEYELPAIEIVGEDGIPIGYRLPRVTVTAVNEKGEFMDIEPPLSLGGNYTRLIILLLAAAAAGAAGYALYRYVKRRMAERAAAAAALPPIEIFRRELAALDGRGLIAGGRVEEYVFGVSLIFRRFLSSQFGFDATEMTTREIAQAMKKTRRADVLARHEGAIIRSFDLWDLAKYAEFAPPAAVLIENVNETAQLAETLAEESSDVAAGV